MPLAMSLGVLGAGTPAVAAGDNCVTSSPPSAAYSVKVCITAPANGATLHANIAVTASITVTWASPGVQKSQWSLDGAYLLTDYQSPHAFTLYSTDFVDGSHTLWPTPSPDRPEGVVLHMAVRCGDASVRQAVILAGGQATRLRPYTDDRPKAMVPVAGRPIANWQLDWLAEQGIEAVVNCHAGGRRSGHRLRPVTHEPYWINGGIYCFEPTVVDLLPDRGDHEDTMFPLLTANKKMGGFKIDGYWRGIDTHKDVVEAGAEISELGWPSSAPLHSAVLAGSQHS